MTKVKICGLMEKSHVLAAVEAGADAIGFVFAPSKRRITVAQAHDLAKIVPADVLKIGVFVNPDQEELERAILEVPLDVIQLHGEEEPDFLTILKLHVLKRYQSEIKVTWRQRKGLIQITCYLMPLVQILKEAAE